MKKKFIALFIIINSIACFFYLSSVLKKEPIRIAVVGPMKLADGEDMRQGAELYRNQINEKGGINGRKLELLFYDDENNPEKAVEVALKIAENNNVLAVIGHFTSDASSAAGKIYKRNEIPAITASATAESVIIGNDWYFRILPDNALQGKFVANYINKGMKKDKASIIYSKGVYGKSLVENFEKTIKDLGMKMVGKWQWDPDKPAQEQLEKIKHDLKTIEDPGVLYFGTKSAVGAKIITSIKDAGHSFPIIVCDAFPGTYLDDLEKLELSNPPEYYSDGIYFVSLFMIYIGGSDAFKFDVDFYYTFFEDPKEMNVCYYDAVHVAAEAIKKIEIHEKKRIREDRRNIRKVLAGFYNTKNSIKGITGSIFFDENGGFKRHLAIGVWQNKQILPAFPQFRQHTADIEINNMLQAVLDGSIVMTDDISLIRTQVVYGHSEIIRVNDIDMNNSEFTADFNLKFRYPDYFDFDEKDIEFENTVSPVVLDNPVKDEISDGIITRVYRIKARFKADIDLHRYPFTPLHILSIRFHHKHLTNAKLIYAPESPYNFIEPPDKLSDKWKTPFVQCYQDVVSKHIFSYSRFNTSIEVVRKNHTIMVILKFVPVILIVLSLYLIYFFPSEKIKTRFQIVIITLAVNTGLYLKHLSSIATGYMTIMDYIYIIIYMLIIISALTSIFLYRLKKAKKEKKLATLMKTGKIAYPCFILSITIVIGLWLVLTLKHNL